LTVKVFQDIRRSTRSMSMSFRRSLTSTATYTLQHGTAVVLVSPREPDSCLLLETQTQTQFPLKNLGIPANAVPAFFDGTLLAWTSREAPRGAAGAAAARGPPVHSSGGGGGPPPTELPTQLRVVLAKAQVMTHFLFF